MHDSIFCLQTTYSLSFYWISQDKIMKKPVKNETKAKTESCSWFLAILLTQIYASSPPIHAVVVMLGYNHS